MSHLLFSWVLTAGFGQLCVIAIGSTIILTLAFLIARRLTNRSAACRFAVWQVAFVFTLLLPLLSICLPTVPLGWSNRGDTSRPSIDSPSAFLRPSNSETVFSNSAPNEPEAIEATHGQVSRRPAAISGTPNEKSRAIPLAPVKQTETNLQRWKVDYAQIAVVVWSLGVVFLCIRLARVHLKVRRLGCLPIAQLHAEVPVVFSPDFKVPVALGIFQPRIVLPIEARQWSTERTELVLAHEIAHVQRHDVFWQTVAALAKCLAWFQPLVWLANRQMILERERACDDRVLSDGAQPTDYAAELLSLAGMLSGRISPHCGVVAMAQKPMESRLRAILDNSVCRDKVQATFYGGVWICFALICVPIAVLRPFDQVNLNDQEISAISSESSNQEPEKLAGKVVDDSAAPIRGAKVSLAIIENLSEIDNARRPPTRLIKEVTVETRDDGSFEISAQGIDANPKKLWLRLLVNANGYYEMRPHFNAVKAMATGELGTITLHKGRLVRGRLNPPKNEAGVITLKNPTVTLATMDEIHSFAITICCELDGRFQTFVPKNTVIQLLATSDNTAAARTQIGPFDEEVDEIDLPLGTSVIGRILDQNNNPVAGMIVRLVDVPNRSEDAMYYPADSAVKSDSNGRFRLPPHLGKAVVCVVATACPRNSFDQSESIHSDRSPPIVSPVPVELVGSQAELEITLKAGPTTKISGTVRWSDNTPAEGVEANASAGNPSVEMPPTITNQQGQYTVEIPSSAEWASVLIMGTRGGDGVFHMAHSEPHPAATHTGSQIVSLRVAKSDMEKVDWELRPFKNPVRPAEHESDREFTKLSERHCELSNKYWAALKAVGDNVPKRARIIAELEPDGLIFDELFAFEEKYRGHPNALKALSVAWQMRTGRLEEGAKQSIAAIRAAELMIEHYIDNPDLDLCFADSNVTGLEIETRLLQTVAEKSPHRHVRATALYSYCLLLSQKLLFHKWMEQSDWKYDRIDPKTIETIKALSPDVLERQVRKASAEINKGYADIKLTSVRHNARYLYGPGLSPQEWDHWRDTDGESQNPLYTTLVNAILFQLDNLAIGKTVPDFDGVDVDGNAFKPSDFRGKVVVVILSHIGSQSAALKKLGEQYADRPFQIIGIINAQNREGFEQETAEVGGSWITTWDQGRPPPITMNWSLNGFPIIYVIDHLGIIRGYAADFDELEQLVEPLVAQAK